MIWLPRTTDNSTYFAQSLEIQGIESRLYKFDYFHNNSKKISSQCFFGDPENMFGLGNK